MLAAGTAGATAYSAVLLSLPVLAPTLRKEFDLTLTEVGIALASVWIGPIFTLLLWGLAADRFGERWSLAAGLAAMGALVAAAGAADDFVLLVLLLASASAAGSSVNSASGRAVMHWFAADERGFALGLRQASLPLGGALAAVTLPTIVGATSLDGGFFFLAVLCFAAALIGALVLRDRPGDADEAEAARWTLRDRRLWVLSGGSGLYLMAQIAMTGFVVLFLHDARGLSNGQAAAVLAVAQVLAIGLRIAAGRWSDRVRTRVGPLRLVGLAICAGVGLTAALVDAPLAVLVPALVVATSLSMTWNGLSYTAAAELAGSARSGAAIGFQQTTLSIVGFLAAPVFAALVDASSWRAGFAVWTVAPLAGWWLLGQLAPEHGGDGRQGEAGLRELGLTGRQPLQRQPRK
ncbi:MAG TPA: MFS transporter [Gaiellaceae bacterium]|nr:MFS transporter [Gaiellaceae bacterium]